MRDIRAGALNTPVALGEPVIVKDAAGGEVLTWNEHDAWANIDPLSGREALGASSVKDSIDARITLRLESIMPSARWRVRDKQTGALYNIVTAMPIPQAGAIECLAKTHSAANDGR